MEDLSVGQPGCARVDHGDGRVVLLPGATRESPSAGGWTIVAVHESQESWERFRDDMLLPRLQEGIDGGLAGPPEETTIDVYKMLP